VPLINPDYASSASAQVIQHRLRVCQAVCANLVRPRGRLANRCIPSTVGMRCPAAPSMTVPTVVIMPKKRAARRPGPPWGRLFGGPLERHVFIRGEKIELGDELREFQYLRMHALLEHYGIVGHVPPYPKGLADRSWWCWYELALAIASEFDDSLEIVNGRPPGKTAARWRGAEGAELIRWVDILRKVNPKRSINWCLQQVQRRIFPNSYGRMSLKELGVRYHEARRYRRTTKRARNSDRAS
jgi:hypothetical protein